MPENTHEALARRFHEEYERLAPSFGYQTREASAVPWADVPSANKSLMVAVAREILAWLVAEGWSKTEPDQWEYGEQSRYDPGTVWTIPDGRPDILAETPPERRVRRRPSGPWEVIPDAE
jgi:hypothetical protein